MYGTVFRIARPFIQGYIMKRVAEYVVGFLNERRAKRLRAEQGTENGDDAPDAPECPPVENGYSSNQVVMFGLTGVLVGSALGAGLSYLLREKELNLKNIF